MTKSRADLYLSAILGGFDLVDKWWQTPCAEFNNQIPLELWNTEAGNSTVKSYIWEKVNQFYKVR